MGSAGVPASSSSTYLTPCSVITPFGAKRASTSATASASSPLTTRETSSQLVIVRTMTNWLEVSLVVNGELAEAVADVLARFAPNGVMTEQGVKYVDDEDAGTPAEPITVRAYLEMNDQIEQTRHKLEES